MKVEQLIPLGHLLPPSGPNAACVDIREGGAKCTGIAGQGVEFELLYHLAHGWALMRGGDGTMHSSTTGVGYIWKASPYPRVDLFRDPLSDSNRTSASATKCWKAICSCCFSYVRKCQMRK